MSTENGIILFKIIQTSIPFSCLQKKYFSVLQCFLYITQIHCYKISVVISMSFRSSNSTKKLSEYATHHRICFPTFSVRRIRGSANT